MAACVAQPWQLPLRQTSRTQQAIRHPCSASSNLLFDIELESDVPQQQQAPCATFLQSALTITQLLASQHTALLRRVHDILDALGRTNHSEPTPEQVAVLLSLQGYEAFVRRATGPRGIEGCLRTLRHSFVVVRDPEGSSKELIVDISFRDHFLLAQSTAEYSALVAALPRVFAGSLTALQPIVNTACSAIAVTYQALNLSVPPWRCAAAMMTKWQPADYVDVPCSFTAQQLAAQQHQHDCALEGSEKVTGESPRSVISSLASQRKLSCRVGRELSSSFTGHVRAGYAL